MKNFKKIASPNREEMNPMWEVLEIKEDGSKTSRLKIQGGWLVRTIMAETGNIAMAFVPDPEHSWGYESEREEQDPDFRWN